MDKGFLSGIPDAIFGENRLPDILPTKFERTIVAWDFAVLLVTLPIDGEIRYI